MSDYERTMQLVNIAQNSAGRSSEQFAKYADTVEYKVNQLSNTWEKFRTGIVDSDAIKGALTFIRGALETVGNIMDSFPGKLALIFAAFGAYKKIKGLVPTAKNISEAFLKGYRDAEGSIKKDLKATVTADGKEAGKDIKNAMDSGGKDIAQELDNEVVKGEKIVEEFGRNVDKLNNNANKG